MYETFVGALEIVRDIEVSVLERFDCTCILKSFAVWTVIVLEKVLHNVYDFLERWIYAFIALKLGNRCFC